MVFVVVVDIVDLLKVVEIIKKMAMIVENGDILMPGAIRSTVNVVQVVLKIGRNV